MRSLFLFLVPTFVGCGASWGLRDEDGDGKSILEGDCYDAPDGGAAIGPDMPEVWYDGVDQNCDGLSDFDQDQDGFDNVDVDGGTDCWDDPTITPTGFTPINGFAALTAADVNEAALETFYDGIDANCDGASDFDQDLDGFDIENPAFGPPDGSGDDCYDSPDVDAYPGDGTEVDLSEPVDVFPGAADDWYDGTDSNCDGGDDYDQDGDTYVRDEECDDTNALIFPDDSVEEVWYNDVDENCDGNLYDKDEDGYDSAVYGGTDCWDDPDTVPTDFTALHGRTQPRAEQVYPDNTTDAWYDGVDADCAGDSDFDQDRDGANTDELTDRSGATGTDCEDEDSEAYLGASEIWYNNADNDCLGGSDFDADGDGQDNESEISTGVDCDDTRAEVNTLANEVCGTAYDDNCDGALDLQNATDCDVFNYDADGDTYGTTSTQCWCEPQVASNYDATNDDDCDDASAGDYPGAAEIAANGDDEDCDSGDTCYVDGDSDGYRNEDTTLTVDSIDLDCNDAGEGSSTELATDCNDSSSGVSPGDAEIVADGIDQDCDDGDTCYVDSDSDGYRSTNTALTVDSTDLDCNDSGEGSSSEAATDCDDSNAGVSPGDAEIAADSIDQDCDSVDSCYTDADNDNYGTAVVVDGSTLNCTTGTGAPVSTDCDDTSSSISPAGTEAVADGIDQDCNSVDSCYTDADGDNYGTTVVVVGSSLSCTTGTGAPDSTDCDDASSSDYPGATETVANSDDEDCDGVDSCYTDADNDNYGTTVVVDGSTLNCATGTGAPVSTDCNDGSSSINPLGTEIVADGIDQDCDVVDSCYTDADGDNYGTTVVSDGSSLSCSTGTGAPVSTDCDDGSSSDYPGATETVGNSDDEDCDGVDSCYTDVDGDNYGTTVVVDGSTLNCATGTGATTSTDCDDGDEYVYPGATELCDGAFNNCTTSGTWTSASEDNVITKVTTGGVASNVTLSSLITLDSTGSYYFCAGTYATKLVGTGSSASVYGYYGAASTILDPASGSAVSATGGSLTVDGFTLTGGTGSSGSGGGAVAGGTRGASPTLLLEDCIVDDNAATNGGGVAVSSTAWMRLVNTVVSANTATSGGGAYVATGGRLDLQTGSTITGNDATNGGGIYVVESGVVTLASTDVYDNTASANGGGIYLDTGTGSCDASSGVYANTAGVKGGGIFINSGTGTFTATSCDFTGSADNAPNDVEVQDSGYTAYLTYGSTATFICSSGLCDPATDP